MSYKPWPAVTKFHDGSTFVYFNVGKSKTDQPMLAVNITGGNAYKSKIVLFENMALPMCKHLLIAVKEAFGFDYIAYLIAAGEIAPVPTQTAYIKDSVDANGLTVDDYIEIEEAIDRNMEELEKARSVIPDMPDEEPDGCSCGNLPGSGSWKFGWHQDVHLSQCLECGRVYRNAGG